MLPGRCVVRSSSVLISFSIAMLLAGVVLAGPGLYQQLPRIGEPGFVHFTAAILVLLGAVSGLMAHRQMRKSCEQVRSLLLKNGQGTSDEPIPLNDRALNPLIQSINQMMMSIRARMNELARKVRELEIQLKVVQLEKDHAESILHSISDAVLVTDPWDELVLANESAARALDFDIPEEGRPPIDQILKDPKLISLIREMRASRSSGGRRVVEHRIQKDGQDRTYKITLSCLAGDRQNGSGVVAVLHDITREAEIAQMKNDFVSHVSHELRTPLASIRAYVEMLIDGEAADARQQAEFYEVIQNEANRLGRLIDNILDISRIESGIVKVNKQPLSLTVVIKEAIEIITPQAIGKKITIHENIAPAIYQTLADKDMIHRAILNLLSNAIKYTPEGGHISIVTDVNEVEKRITVKISDTGVGIPPKDLPHVFDKFYRVEANNRMAKGTGLGLSLVKHIVETVHHGKVSVESTVGQGSTFSIELSLCE